MDPQPLSRRSSFGPFSLFLVFFLLWIGVPALSELYTDLAWFKTVSQEHTYLTIFRTRVMLGLATGLLMAAFVYLNGRFAIANAKNPIIASMSENWRPAPDASLPIANALIPVSLGLGALTGWVASHAWQVVLLWRHGGSFGLADPIFGRDIGFHVFTLPMISGLRVYLFWLVALALIISLATYLTRGSLLVANGRVHASSKVLTHLGILAALLFSLLALDAWLDSLELLRSNRGPVSGASYADIHATLPALRITMATALLAVIASLVAPRSDRWRFWGLAVALHFLAVFFGLRVYPDVVQRFSVKPNEAVKEATFIEYNIEATRRAYGLDNVVDRELKGEQSLTMADIDNNRATIDNIRLWDHKPLLETFAQIQEIRTYYDFASVDNDRYEIDGQMQQIMLSPRELSSASIPSRTWINEHLTFTHGYGLTLGPVNEARSDGLPKLYIQDIPPKSNKKGLEVKQPGIYFGELSNQYVFVQTKNKEFDHPSGNERVFADYTGKAGIPLRSFLSQAAMSIRLRTLKLLLSDDIDSQSRVLLHRNVQNRITEIAPFLILDSDPYMVIGKDGGLHWIQDAYTTSEHYPYSQRRSASRALNYIRNAVKVTVDAYNGSVDFYINDAKDPIVKAWAEAFPEMFKRIDAMPEDLQAHLRYPKNLFKLQAELFSTYHMDTASLVYSREDQWEFPAIDKSHPMEPYYTIMRLPQEEEPEFILMLPFTPQRKLNLAAWMVARNDGDLRGQLIIYRFPKDKLIYGPAQVMNRINQDEVISEQRTLWDQQGSQAVFGTLLVIPIEESLIYVAPLYLRSGAPPIPQLKRVIVVYRDQIAMRPTLDEAIDAVFAMDGSARDRADPEGTPTIGDALPIAPLGPQKKGSASARAHGIFKAAVAAQRKGDWAEYGRQIDALGKALEKMATETKTKN